MGFFNQSKQDQRSMERMVIIFYSLYTINLYIGMIRLGVKLWIPIVMLVLGAVSWGVFFSNYKTFRIRAAITSCLMQITVILCAANTDKLSEVVPTFMVFTVLVAMYGQIRLLWLTIASILFIIFYHSVITDTFMAQSKETIILIASQLGNVICLEIILYIWLRKRDEATKQIDKVIDTLIEAEQSKDDFLANVSHEIRTPVNTICGMSEMALREQDMKKMRDEVLDIRDAGHNLMSIVNDILDFAQLQQDKMDIEEEAYNITSTINDIINMALARKGDKQIEFIVDCDANIPSGLLGDEKKIRRVIMNIVDNAIKFTNDGGVIIDIHARREDYGINLCVSVKDTGSGIGEESLEKLFESFSQVDTRRNRQNGGVGLGLAISRALVQKMGGTITVQSRVNKGSIFRFVVPQKVLDENRIGQVINRHELNIAAYFDMEQFDMITIRDEYSKLIMHMVKQLQVKCHVCRNLAELKRRHDIEPFTHIFISLEEYQEDEAYFDELTKHTKVILVLERFNEKYVLNQDIIRLYKPFYILPVVSILNGNAGSGGGKQIVRMGKFTAPNAHVLVVDDNLMNIRVVEGLLKEYQIKVTYATSGQEALKIIEKMCFDFVFMDHMMPEMDGVETMHRIRDKAGHYYQKVPIIALTANAVPGNREMFLEEGFNDFVAKPLEMSVLERVLRRNLPEEKLVLHTRDEQQSMEQQLKESNEKEEKLKIGDLNVEQGLLYCGGPEAYLEILERCFEDGVNERQLLEKLYEEQDWKNYTIRVHGLKSTMQSIGAIPLFEKAKALEMAGKNEDIDYILEWHKDMIAEHIRVMEELEHCPKLHHKLPEDVLPSALGQEKAAIDLPKLDDDMLDSLLTEFEAAMYDLNEEEMLLILGKIQEYQYCGASLKEKLALVKKKVEMSDYMSAVDLAYKIREELKNNREGEFAND